MLATSYILEMWTGNTPLWLDFLMAADASPHLALALLSELSFLFLLHPGAAFPPSSSEDAVLLTVSTIGT